ncbi:MAG: hypothetical protein KGJ23_09705 [Euryarchaeota archaeon]|nr:hypothetical protein [Euryarchaeota archaeon]MDE1836877.1 hypothetical protein [Euryarchaeota archaeon]MDE1881361.1 hypothetical protein [Euryarchaeota archaeon]MDE2045280.1 hypothetical protein [Thermoplasmata archaeon]
MSASQEDLRALERRVARLEQLVAEIARKMDVRTDNPSDQRSITNKVSYDWQR